MGKARLLRLSIAIQAIDDRVACMSQGINIPKISQLFQLLQVSILKFFAYVSLLHLSNFTRSSPAPRKPSLHLLPRQGLLLAYESQCLVRFLPLLSLVLLLGLPVVTIRLPTASSPTVGIVCPAGLHACVSSDAVAISGVSRTLIDLLSVIRNLGILSAIIVLAGNTLTWT